MLAQFDRSIKIHSPLKENPAVQASDSGLGPIVVTRLCRSKLGTPGLIFGNSRIRQTSRRRSKWVLAAPYFFSWIRKRLLESRRSDWAAV